MKTIIKYQLLSYRNDQKDKEFDYIKCRQVYGKRNVGKQPFHYHCHFRGQ